MYAIRSYYANGFGGIVDDLLVYRVAPERFLLVVNAANIEKDWNWCVKIASEFGIIPGENLINASDITAQLAVQGPFALKAMHVITSYSIHYTKLYEFTIK